MFKRARLGVAIAATLAIPVTANALLLGDSTELTIHLQNKTAAFIEDGQVIGEADDMFDNSGHDAGDIMRFENTIRMYFNGELGDIGTWHADLNLVYDTEAIDDYQGHELYSQYDYLRELYMDTSLAGWDMRLGKQQVVWGTADGIKLLDIINPTDYRYVVQESLEDSRIPIWMFNASRYIGDSANIQLIVSQVEENKIPGLNSDGDDDHPFLMKGIDSITGDVNGFRSITPALSNVAGSFNNAAVGGFFTGGAFNPAGLTPFGGMTVDGFASTNWEFGFLPGDFIPDYLTPTPSDPNGTTIAPGYILLNEFAQNGFSNFTGQPDPNANDNITNLMPVITAGFLGQSDWNPSGATSAFEYMSNATFATFNTFTNIASCGAECFYFTGTESEWKRDYPSDSDVNAGFRFRNSLDNGLNFSVNYFYHYSANPDINLSWNDPNTGEELTVQRAATVDAGGGFFVPDASTDLTRDQARANWDLGSPTTILVHNSADEYYGAITPDAWMGQNASLAGTGYAPNLRFTETLHRVHSLGGSFDYAFDTALFPVVVRGEFLYDKDDKQPVVDKYLLSIGDLTNALKMEDADYFKYVLGVDITVMTNLLISGQFIQFRNLDFVDQKDSCNTQGNLAGAPGDRSSVVDCSRYTGDLPTLHMSNGLNQAEKNKEFYSLFFSKPFGESQLGRWNDIIMYEENGGWWNRFDVEYSFSDEFIATAALNTYWGDEDTQFGQFKESSNIQVGFKYIIE